MRNRAAPFPASRPTATPASSGPAPARHDLPCSASPDRPVLEVEGLSKDYDGRLVLDTVTFRITAGEIVGLLGRNGAGKSTLMEILCGLRLPRGGRVRVCGTDPAGVRHPGTLPISTVVQDTALDPVMTARESLELQGRMLGLRASGSRRRAADLLDLLDLAARADDRIGTLSGGWRRRVDLAVALVRIPALLVLDEPTSGLDPVARAQFWQQLRTVNEEHGTAVLLCTQDLAEADALADRLLLLRAGKLVAAATPAELKSMVGSRTLVVELAPEVLPDASAVLSGEQAVLDPDHDGRVLVPLGPDDGAITRLVGGLAAAGVPIHRLGVCEPTLDDVFIRLADTRTNSRKEPLR